VYHDNQLESLDLFVSDAGFVVDFDSLTSI